MTIGGMANIAYGVLGNTQSPIPAAHVKVTFYVTQDNDPHTKETDTAANGAFSVSDANLTLKPASGVAVTLYAGVASAMAGNAPVTQFVVDDPGRNNAVWSTEVRGTPTVSPTNPTSFTFNANVAANGELTFHNRNATLTASPVHATAI